jgi:hypothetical protein
VLEPYVGLMTLFYFSEFIFTNYLTFMVNNAGFQGKQYFKFIFE